jgi:predicted nucleotidyltransferase
LKKERLDLRPKDLALVRAILRRHVPGCRVWVFGSRATGRAKPMSDLDLAIEDGQSLSLIELGGLAEAFEESDLPMKVDVVDLSQASPAFRRIIDEQKQRVQ